MLICFLMNIRLNLQHQHSGLGAHDSHWNQRSHKVRSRYKPFNILHTHTHTSKEVDRAAWYLSLNSFVDACSVRVSNELGAAHPRTAKFSLVVATLASLMIGLVIALILVLARNLYPDLFTNDAGVKELVKELTPLLAVCIIINNVQPVLSGN